MLYNVLKELLFEKAEKNIDNHDPSHDIQHCMRVLKNCEKIVEKE
jgi:HD superfamily phosphodiesterase